MPKVPRPPKAPKPFDPSKAVLAPPRLRPISTRDYGKGTPLSGAPDLGLRGAGIGYGGPPEE
jgi:hypothetical protein